MRRNAVVAVLIALAAWVRPSSASAQLHVLGGAWLGVGTLDAPYFFDCAPGDDTGASAASAYAGLGYDAFSVTAHYLEAGERSSDDGCTLPPPPPDGTYRVREFDTRRSGRLWAWAVNMRYAPHSFPVMVYVGGGTETEGNTFRSAGLVVRSRGALRVYGGVEISQFRTPYADVDQSWASGTLIDRVEVRRGNEWRDLQILKAGIEYAWSFR